MINVVELTKNFGDNTVLNGVNVSFAFNSISVVLGKSGEGKSTLFRILTNIEKPTEGYIEIDQEQVGMVFQDYQLFPHYNVLNNLIVPQKVILKRSKKDALIRAEEALEKLNILHLKESKISQLSGGESQRVAIARLLVMDKSIFLFDEPTSALDKENIDNLIVILKEMKSNSTILIISHDRDFAYKVADDIFLLEQGKIKKA